MFHILEIKFYFYIVRLLVSMIGMTEIVICGYARSAFTPAKKGQLCKTRPDDLAAKVIKGLIEKSKINSDKRKTTHRFGISLVTKPYGNASHWWERKRGGGSYGPLSYQPCSFPFSVIAQSKPLRSEPYGNRFLFLFTNDYLLQLTFYA